MSVAWKPSATADLNWPCSHRNNAAHRHAFKEKQLRHVSNRNGNALTLAATEQTCLRDCNTRRVLLSRALEAGTKCQAAGVCPKALHILAILYKVRVVRTHDLRPALALDKVPREHVYTSRLKQTAEVSSHLGAHAWQVPLA